MSAPNDPDPLTGGVCTGDPLAKALSHLEPMPAPLSRDALMFAAGAAGRDRDVAFWKRIVYGQATAACLLVGVGLAVNALPDAAPGGRGGNPFDGPAAKNTSAPAPVPPTPTPTPEAVAVAPPRDVGPDTAKMAKYLQLRADVLAGGIGVLPNPNAPAGAVDVGTLEDSLQLPRGTFASHARPVPPKPAPPADDEDR